MSLERPRFELMRIADDGMQEAPAIIPVSIMPSGTEIDRRSFLSVGLSAAVVLLGMSGSSMDAQAAASPSVREAQKRLKAAGFDPGPLDGLLGVQMKAALRQYQRAHDLPVTGVLDEATRQSLGLPAQTEKPDDTPPPHRLGPRMSQPSVRRGTQPCGTPIPPGAVCTCNCVPAGR